MFRYITTALAVSTGVVIAAAVPQQQLNPDPFPPIEAAKASSP